MRQQAVGGRQQIFNSCLCYLPTFILTAAYRLLPAASLPPTACCLPPFFPLTHYFPADNR